MAAVYRFVRIYTLFLSTQFKGDYLTVHGGGINIQANLSTKPFHVYVRQHPRLFIALNRKLQYSVQKCVQLMPSLLEIGEQCLQEQFSIT